MKSILTEDFNRQVLYLTEEIFLTLRTLFTRPGTGIREYIGGHRVRYTGNFTLLAVMILIFYGTEVLTNFQFSSLMPDRDEQLLMTRFDRLLREHPKALFLSLVPLYAFLSWLFFRKAGYNFAEHLVLNTYRMAANLLLNIAFLLTTLVVTDVEILRWIDQLLSVVVSAYGTYFLFQFFEPYYTHKGKLLARSLACILAAFPVLLGLLTFYLYHAET